MNIKKMILAALPVLVVLGAVAAGGAYFVYSMWQNSLMAASSMDGSNPGYSTTK